MTADDVIKRVEEIEGRESNATGGVWKFGELGRVWSYPLHKSNLISDLSRKSVAVCFGDSQKEIRANAEFVAHAREDIPWLLDHLALCLDTIDSCMATHVNDKIAYERLAEHNAKQAIIIDELAKKIAALNRALDVAALEAYKSEVIDTEMVSMIIGCDKEYADQNDWLDQRIAEWKNR